jgi:subtilisin family serine protease
MIGQRRLNAIEPALERAAAARAVIVMAAGNDGRALPDWPARYAQDRRFSGAIVIAGASNIKVQLAKWSNKAGDFGYRFVAAPGENLLVDCDERTCRCSLEHRTPCPTSREPCP